MVAGVQVAVHGKETLHCDSVTVYLLDKAKNELVSFVPREKEAEEARSGTKEEEVERSDPEEEVEVERKPLTPQLPPEGKEVSGKDLDDILQTIQKNGYNLQEKYIQFIKDYYQSAIEKDQSIVKQLFRD